MDVLTPTRSVKRMLVGRAMRSNQLPETELRKRLALPVFCSDPLSSVAYATEEILLVLSLGGLALLHLAWPVALAIVVLLVIAVASYRPDRAGLPGRRRRVRLSEREPRAQLGGPAHRR